MATPTLLSNNSATWILTNASGCDSTVTLDLTITTLTPEQIHKSLVVPIHGLMGIPIPIQTIQQHSIFQEVQQVDATPL